MYIIRGKERCPTQKIKKRAISLFQSKAQSTNKTFYRKSTISVFSDLSLILSRDAVNDKRVTRVIDPKYDIRKVTFNINRMTYKTERIMKLIALKLIEIIKSSFSRTIIPVDFQEFFF